MGRAASLGLGIDFRVLPMLALGPEFRAGLAAYRDATSSSDDDDFSVLFFTLGVTGTFLIEP